MEMPKKGDKVYIPTQLYIDSGELDVQGGLATIEKVITKECSNPYNTVFVVFEEITHYYSEYNWNHILENQEKWAKVYAGRVAYSDPDYNY